MAKVDPYLRLNIKYSLNYQRLRNCLPKYYQEGERFRWTFQNGKGYEILIDQCCNHYELIKLQSESINHGSWSNNLNLNIRVYHDAQTAEVEESSHFSMQKKHLLRTNAWKKSHALHEKWQLNLLLSETLNHIQSLVRVKVRK